MLGLLLLVISFVFFGSSQEVCIFGDVNVFYNSSRDFRTLMGTYSVASINNIANQVFDPSATVYSQNRWNSPDGTIYLVRYVTQTRWLLANTPPNTTENLGIFASCYTSSSDPSDCTHGNWYWGFDNQNFPMPNVTAKVGKCEDYFCVTNGSMTVSSTDYNMTGLWNIKNANNSYNLLYNNRTYWTLSTNSEYVWFWKPSINNWVLKSGAAELVACAPDSVPMPLWCQSFNYNGAATKLNELEWDIGDCPTASPTTSPTLLTIAPTINPSVNPTMNPTLSPTKYPTTSPTETNYCIKDYLFKTTVSKTNVTIECPFGFWGDYITRYCDSFGIWNNIYDGCRKISFRDDFKYWRDEIWNQYNYPNVFNFINTNEELFYMYAGSNGSKLETYSKFKAPLRIEYSFYTFNASTCNDGIIGFGSNVSSRWNCYNTLYSCINSCNSVSIDSLNSSKLDYHSGSLLYHLDNNSSSIVTSKLSNSNGVSRSESRSLQNDNTIFFTSDSLNRRLIQAFDSNYSYVNIFNSIRVTSFIDTFSSSNMSHIWTGYGGVIWHGNSPFENNGLKNYFLLETSSNVVSSKSITLNGTVNSYVVSNSSKFEFSSPFEVRTIMAFDSNGGTDNIVRVSSFNTTLNFDIYVEVEVKNDDVMKITVMDNESSSSDVFTGTVNISDCISTYKEVLVTLRVMAQNLTCKIEKFTGSQLEVCDTLIINDNDVSTTLMLSNGEWNELKLSSNNSKGIFSYLDVFQDLVEEIITISPTSNPTLSPTSLPCNASDGFPYTEGLNYAYASCSYGSYGTSNRRYCNDDGTWDSIEYGCTFTSFSEDFEDSGKLDDIYWKDLVSVTDCDGTCSDIIYDGELNLNTTTVGVVKTLFGLELPFKAEFYVTMNHPKCNSWFIAIGRNYTQFWNSSIRVQWNCKDNTTHLTNSTFKKTNKFYCWNGGGPHTTTISITMTEADGVRVRSSNGCIDVSVRIDDIINDNNNGIWNSSIFLGTFDNNNGPAGHARFGWMYTTQFYDNFDGSNSIWDDVGVGVQQENVLYFGLPARVSFVSLESITLFKIPVEIKFTMHSSENNGYGNSISFSSNRTGSSSSSRGDTTNGDVTIQFNSEGAKSVNRRRLGDKKTIIIDSDSGSWSVGSKDCNYFKNASVFKTSIDVTITVYKDIVEVTSGDCDSLVGEHDLTSRIVEFQLGVSDGFEDTVGFSSFEVSAISGSASAPNSLTPSPTISGNSSSDLLGSVSDIVIWIILVSVFLLICIYFTCAYHYHWCPFRKKKGSEHEKLRSQKSDNGISGPQTNPYLKGQNIIIQTSDESKNTSEVQMQQILKDQQQLMMLQLQQQQEISKQQAQLLAYQMQKQNPNLEPNTDQLLGSGSGEGGEGRNRVESVLGPQSEGEWTSPQPQPQIVKFVNILSDFRSKVKIDDLFKLVPQINGRQEIDSKRSKLFIAAYREVSPLTVEDMDPGVKELIGKNKYELEKFLTNCPEYAVQKLKGNKILVDNNSDNKKVDFLNLFLKNCNIKAVYAKLSNDYGDKNPRLDERHARILIANLREASFGQVLPSDRGVALLIGKTAEELRSYLSNISLSDLRLLDLKSYHLFSGNNETPQGPVEYINGPSVYGNNDPVLEEGGLVGNSYIPIVPESPTEVKNQLPKIKIPVIKVDFNSDIRRFRPHSFQCYQDLLQFITNTWPYAANGNLRLSYVDSENDRISISSDLELQEGLRHALETNSESLKVIVATSTYQE